MKLVLRKPPRCLDCSHSVGPTGDHVVIWSLVFCKRCRALGHFVSMALKYEGTWI